MSMTDTTSGTEVEILNELDWTPTEPCSFTECPRDAEWYALCPHDRSAETCCSEHKDIVISDEIPLAFSETCRHVVQVANVIWEPYT